MPQQRFTEVSFERCCKHIRREQFLDEMNRVVSWAELVAAIESVYPEAEGRVVRQWVSSAYCAFIVCNDDPISLILPSKLRLRAFRVNVN